MKYNQSDYINYFVENCMPMKKQQMEISLNLLPDCKNNY